eukprot:scaffold183449_cov18-Prasinocladus_malaysianus.AAC.4
MPLPSKKRIKVVWEFVEWTPIIVQPFTSMLDTCSLEDILMLLHEYWHVNHGGCRPDNGTVRNRPGHLTWGILSLIFQLL